MPITTSTLRVVRYPPERFVDATISTIAANGGTIGPPPPLYLTTLLSRYGHIARLRDISTDGTASVNLLTTIDGRGYPPSLQNAIAQRPLSTPGGEDLTATDAVTLNLQNLGSAQAANVRADWALDLWPPTIADKVALRIPLTAAETALWNRLAPAGYVPRITPDILWEQEYAAPQLMEWAGTVNVVAGQAVVIGQGSPPAGYFDAILYVAVDASVGGTITLANQAANAILVNIDRDSDAQVDVWPAAGVVFSPTAGFQHGARPRIVSRNTWTTYLTTTQTVNGVPYRVVAGRYVEQPAQRARWGVDTEGIPQDVFDQVQAGLV